VKGSFGRVTEVSHVAENSLEVHLALEIMNNGHGSIASWSVDECKKRSDNWLRKKIESLITELTNFKREH